MAWPAVAGAVSAGAGELAVVVDVEVFDIHGAFAIELEDFVGGFLGAAADDVGCAGGLLEGCGVLADVQPPDVLDGTKYILGQMKRELKMEGIRTRCPCSGYPRPGLDQESRS